MGETKKKMYSSRNTIALMVMHQLPQGGEKKLIKQTKITLKSFIFRITLLLTEDKTVIQFLFFTSLLQTL